MTDKLQCAVCFDGCAVKVIVLTSDDRCPAGRRAVADLSVLFTTVESRL